MRRLLVLLLLTACHAPPPAAPGPDAPLLSHGLAAGDVHADRAVVWLKADRPAHAFVAYHAEQPLGRVRYVGPIPLEEAEDFTRAVPLLGLRPDRFYTYHILLAPAGVTRREAARVVPGEGRFRTAPSADRARRVRLLWSGDLGGQHRCRPPAEGYAIFAAMARRDADFAVLNGDLIYADGVCPPLDPDGQPNLPGQYPSVADPALDWRDEARLREVFFAHWRYNRADPAVQHFLSRTPVYVQWDDHEVVNDFGAGWDHWNAHTTARPGFPTLVKAGRAAFFAWAPLQRHPAEPDRIYRSFRWGRHVELFIVDARSYRSRNDAPDGPRKTLLGAAQRDWLVAGLTGSRATFKIVAIDVPLSLATGTEPALMGRDAVANGSDDPAAARTGFEAEVGGILKALDAARVRGLVFLATDVHHPELIHHAVDLDGDGRSLRFLELLSGPLRAVRGRPYPLDPTFAPRSLWADGDLDNFGELDIEPHGDGAHLTTRIFDAWGHERPGSRLTFTPDL
jgi:alkaline phosphatase D